MELSLFSRPDIFGEVFSPPCSLPFRADETFRSISCKHLVVVFMGRRLKQKVFA